MSWKDFQHSSLRDKGDKGDNVQAEADKTEAVDICQIFKGRFISEAELSAVDQPAAFPPVRSLPTRGQRIAAALWQKYRDAEACYARLPSYLAGQKRAGWSDAMLDDVAHTCREFWSSEYAAT